MLKGRTLLSVYSSSHIEGVLGGGFIRKKVIVLRKKVKYSRKEHRKDRAGSKPPGIHPGERVKYSRHILADETGRALPIKSGEHAPSCESLTKAARGYEKASVRRRRLGMG